VTEYAPVEHRQKEAAQVLEAPGPSKRKALLGISNLARSSPQGNPLREDSSGERDLLLSGLRLAATRSRLKTSVFETLHVALRQKQTNCAGVRQRLREEGLIDQLPFGREGTR
jgi:hypothetical protein